MGCILLDKCVKGYESVINILSMPEHVLKILSVLVHDLKNSLFHKPYRKREVEIIERGGLTQTCCKLRHSRPEGI